jgi:DUF2075 family protein
VVIFFVNYDFIFIFVISNLIAKNYTGVIFGNEIDYNSITKKIEIDSTKYYDQYGKYDTSDEELKSYIINIYKTLMYRGIKGTYVYACNKGLREYLKIHIKEFNE